MTEKHYLEELRENWRPLLATKNGFAFAPGACVADDPAMQARWGGGDAVATFAALRAAKDNF